MLNAADDPRRPRHPQPQAVLHGGAADRNPGGRGGHRRRWSSASSTRFLQVQPQPARHRHHHGQRQLLCAQAVHAVPVGGHGGGRRPSRRGSNSIKAELNRVPNVRVHSDLPRWAYVQALLARGDRRVARHPRPRSTPCPATGPRPSRPWPINPDFYVLRERDLDEILPWDFIDHRVTKAFLKHDYQPGPGRPPGRRLPRGVLPSVRRLRRGGADSDPKIRAELAIRTN
ncbi:MAG: hypothetical protein MZV70_20270 [Desulfobacterales bacterium]|nr:hypothetical protein [Desulfobacterales bacterium]